MDVNLVGAGLREGLDQNLRLRAHEMNVAKDPCYGTNPLHQTGAKRKVGHEMAVHDIHVQPIGARTIYPFGLFGQPSIIRCQQRGRNNHAHRLNVKLQRLKPKVARRKYSYVKISAPPRLFWTVSCALLEPARAVIKEWHLGYVFVAASLCRRREMRFPGIRTSAPPAPASPMEWRNPTRPVLPPPCWIWGGRQRPWKTFFCLTRLLRRQGPINRRTTTTGATRPKKKG